MLSKENLLQNSVDDSWTDSNLNRVSVIQFQEETKAEEEDDEAAAERRVSTRDDGVLPPKSGLKLIDLNALFFLVLGPSAQSNTTPQ